MTQSSDREHRTPLSPVSRHESITGAFHALTPEPAKLKTLLPRRMDKTRTVSLKLRCFALNLPPHFVKTQEELRRLLIYGPGLTVVRVETHAHSWLVPTVSCLLRKRSYFDAFNDLFLNLKCLHVNDHDENMDIWQSVSTNTFSFYIRYRLPAPFCSTVPWLVHIPSHPRSPRNVCCSHWMNYFNTNLMSMPGGGRKSSGGCVRLPACTSLFCQSDIYLFACLTADDSRKTSCICLKLLV